MKGLAKALMTQDEFESHLRRRGFEVVRDDVPAAPDHYGAGRYFVQIITSDERRSLCVACLPSDDGAPFFFHDDYWSEDNERGYKTIGALVRKLRYNLSDKRAVTY